VHAYAMAVAAFQPNKSFVAHVYGHAPPHRKQSAPESIPSAYSRIFCCMYHSCGCVPGKRGHDEDDGNKPTSTNLQAHAFSQECRTGELEMATVSNSFEFRPLFLQRT
jgi:hypothetical protein